MSALPPATKYRLKATGEIVDVHRMETDDDRRALRASKWATRIGPDNRVEHQVTLLTYPSQIVLFVNDAPVVPGDYIAVYENGTLDAMAPAVLASEYEAVPA